MPNNQLADEKSPYLIQHAENPVEWYPWSEEAFEKAREEDKPVFLSIGYATCHWCHVMAHESFEDPEVAELMNDTFVNIKVDREERPDIDNTYMTVCQMLTGSGGWPLTIFMTPEKKPFYAATYIPKRGRYGRPGMLELIPRIRELWNENREKVDGSADEITQAFRESNEHQPGSVLDESDLDEAFRQFRRQYDPEHGGFGGAPKFPAAHNLMYILRYGTRNRKDEAFEMVDKTLTEMRRGGMYDHIGFGFHRYSTDAEWLLPHFEKMLYDQAMLMMAYTEAWQVSQNALFKQTVDEVATYVFRDMTDEKGAFYSAEDADSEGEEGKFYVWTVEEVRSTLSLSEAELFIEVFNLEEEGNYKEEASKQKTGTNIPHVQKSTEELAAERNLTPEELNEKLESIRQKLFEKREKRIRPLLDDKILTDWNGLMIAALAKAGRVFDRHLFIEKAEAASSFILETMFTGSSLKHRYREGDVAFEGHADDYAFFIWGLTELYEATGDPSYLDKSLELNDIFLNDFWDEDDGAFFFTGERSEELLDRKKESYDGAIPSGNSVAMLNLLRLGKITANPEWEEKAEKIGILFSRQIKKAPTGFGQILQAVDFGIGPSFEVVISGHKDEPDTQKMLKKLHTAFIPRKVLVLNDPEDKRIQNLAPYVETQSMLNNAATAYVCRNYSCEQPTNDPEEMMELILSSENG